MTQSKGSINMLKASCERNVKCLHFKGTSITINFRRPSKDTMIKGVLHIIKNQGCIKPLSFMFPKTQDEGCKPSSRVSIPHQHTSDPYARGPSSPCKYEGFFKLLWASTHYDQLVGPSTSSRASSSSRRPNGDARPSPRVP